MEEQQEEEEKEYREKERKDQEEEKDLRVSLYHKAGFSSQPNAEITFQQPQDNYLRDNVHHQITIHG